MKKKFSLQTMEMAEAAVQDAVNFGLNASIEENDGEISIAYDSPAACKSEEVKAVCWEDVYSIVNSVANEYAYQMKWLREDISYLREALYKHTGSGHLPPIGDSGLMEKALKVLGLGDSFEVKKPQVYVQY